MTDWPCTSCIYMSICMPVIDWIATGGDAPAYRYLLQGIREFLAAERLAGEIRDLGFDKPSFERLSRGIAATHVASKPYAMAASALDHTRAQG